jgi:cell division protein ZapA (FtsZ GTPase activity inhibitor)
LESVIKIEIFGRKYSFKAETEGNIAREIADVFVKEVTKIETEYKLRSSEINGSAILILTALNSIKHNFDLKQKNSAFMTDVSKRCEKIIETFDSAT